MGRLQCPQCGTIVEEQPGQPTVCPSCGFSGDPPQEGDPAPQETTYSATPFGGGAPYGGYAPPPSPVPQPPQPPAGGAPGQYGHQQQSVPPTNGLAIGSLVCGLVALCVPIIDIVAIVLGVIARNQIKQTGERGEGMAIAGIVLGSVLLAFRLMFFMFMPFGRWGMWW